MSDRLVVVLGGNVMSLVVTAKYWKHLNQLYFNSLHTVWVCEWGQTQVTISIWKDTTVKEGEI